MRYWILDGHRTVPTDDVFAWARMLEDDESRTVGKTVVGDLLVSTVFIGIDHAFGGGPPLLFETMIFGGDDEMMQRYTTWEQARDGHVATVADLERTLVR